MLSCRACHMCEMKHSYYFITQYHDADVMWEITRQEKKDCIKISLYHGLLKFYYISSLLSLNGFYPFQAVIASFVEKLPISESCPFYISKYRFRNNGADT